MTLRGVNGKSHKDSGAIRDHYHIKTPEIQLYIFLALVSGCGTGKMKRILFLSAVCIGLAGCGTTITNLTPRHHLRSSNGLYPVEVAWDSTQKTIKEKTIKPYVIVGTEAYPMRPSPMVPNRWETMIPVPPDQNLVNYRFKFDYDYRAIPATRGSSKLSAPYRIEIKDR